MIDWRIENGGNHVEADLAGRRVTFRTGGAGHHWALIGVSVLGAAWLLGADLDMAAAKVDLLFSCGPDMAGLSAAVPSRMDALHTDTSDGLIGLLTETVGAGDVVTVKGSLGSRMAPVVEALMALDAGNGDDSQRARAAGGRA